MEFYTNEKSKTVIQCFIFNVMGTLSVAPTKHGMENNKEWENVVGFYGVSSAQKKKKKKENTYRFGKNHNFMQHYTNSVILLVS